MSNPEIQVILNELKHIREDIAELKEANKHKCDDCTKVAILNSRLENYEKVVKDVESLKTEKTTLQKLIPYLWSALVAIVGWLVGGGWKFFVG